MRQAANKFLKICGGTILEKQIGKQSVRFENPPYIMSSAAIVGQKEGEGPYGKFFDEILMMIRQAVSAGRKRKENFRKWRQIKRYLNQVLKKGYTLYCCGRPFGTADGIVFWPYET